MVVENNMQSAKLFILLLTLLAFTGCEVMPQVRYKPTLHNPFVQIHSVAIVPFENLTGNDSVNGIEFANQFALELQRVPGFRVIAIQTILKVMWEHELETFESVDDIRYLAKLLGADVVVIGRIHNFSMSHPPTTKFETTWYHVNPYLQPIVEGYGLPWGTEFERFIPDRIVMQAERNLAAAQIRTQTPEFDPVQRRSNSSDTPADGISTFQPLTTPALAHRRETIRQMSATIPNNLQMRSIDEDDFIDSTLHQQDLAISRALARTGVPFVPEATPHTRREQRDYSVRHNLEHPLKHGPWQSQTAQEGQLPWSMQNHLVLPQNMSNPGGFSGHYPGFPPPAGMPAEQLTEFGWVAAPIMPVQPMYPMMPGMPVVGYHGMIMGEPDRFPGLPHDWPDPRGFIPAGPQPERPVGTVRNEGPIISWINVYKSNDSEFMQALAEYDLLFRDDRRLSGKQAILMNSNEFIAFCCRMHIWEIFTARGGAGPAQRVTRLAKPWHGGGR